MLESSSVRIRKDGESEGEIETKQRIWSDIHAFYFSEAESEGKISAIGETLLLPESEFRHARAVRLRQGERVMVLDGRGTRSFGEYLGGDRRGMKVSVEESTFEEPEEGLYIGLAIGLLDDRSRCAFLYEKCVELGVNVVHPLASARSQGRFRRERVERVGVAALKQSQRSRLPELHDPIDVAGLIEIFPAWDRVLFCHEGVEAGGALVDRANRRGSTLVVVGPEGGFTEEEVAEISGESRVEVTRLGAARLRAESAAIAMVAALRVQV